MQTFTVSQLEAALLAVRPKAMDKNYNQCGMYEKGQCDQYAVMVRGFAKCIYEGYTEDDKTLRVDFVLRLLRPAP